MYTAQKKFKKHLNCTSDIDEQIPHSTPAPLPPAAGVLAFTTLSSFLVYSYSLCTYNNNMEITIVTGCLYVSRLDSEED